jgi:ATP-dependent Clp protease protease subunit
MKNLIQLYLANAKAQRDFRIENAGGDEATVYIYDVIGDWFGGVNAKEFAKDLDALKAKTIHVRINSPGGDVFDGRAIASALQRHSAKVVAHIDGMAASSASWIALAADEVLIAPGAFFMIHNSWTMTVGDKRDMTEASRLLEQIDATFVSDYVARTKNSEQQIREWMDAETWFEAADAVKHGFAHAIEESAKKSSNAWDLAAYKNPPKALTAEPAADPELQFDRAALERRLALLEKIAA